MKWSSDLAYAVGLITTDGSLSSDGRHISLTSADTQLLNTFKQCLNKANRITINPHGSYSRNTIYKVQVGDVKLYRWLNTIGLFSKKTFTIGSLKIPQKYFRDFLRGHLDGDGSIIYYQDRYNTKLNPKYIYDRLIVYFISSSLPHIEWLRSNINSIKEIKGSFQKKIDPRREKSHPMYVIKFSTKEAKILLKWIYYKEDLPLLKRKYLIAKPFLTI